MVSWGEIPEADNYSIFRSGTGASGSFNYRGTVTSNSYLDTGVSNGQTYYYYVMAGNAAGGSNTSAVTNATVNLGPPSGLRAVLNNAQVNLTWGGPADADSYSVFRSVYLNLGYFNYIGTANTSSYLDTNANTGWPVYYYYVVPNNQAGSGIRSAVVSTDGRVFPCPPTVQCVVPHDRPSGGADGGSGDDPVNLATGMEEYQQRPDLVVYNPNGPQVGWQRQYLGYQALGGYASPGLSPGWVHTYDVSVQGPAAAGTWGALTLLYYNGAVETLTPVLDGAGQPTGVLTPSAGAPYLAQGVAGASAGTWQSITVTWKDQTRWVFSPLSSGTYALGQITNRTGQGITFTWNGSRALTQVSDTSSSATLLTLAYGSDGRLASATDAYNRQIVYTYSAPYGSDPGLLQAVSQVVNAGTSNPPAHWTYGYAATGQLLSTISVPSPTGSGTSTATINYDLLGRVASLVDANGNQRVYTYNAGTTQVQVENAANTVVQSWTQKFTGQRDTGATDANNKSTTVAYTDPQNPSKPTSVTDKNGKITTYTYDSGGNVRTVTTPRNVTTTYTYDYTAFALGRLTSVQEGTRPATNFTYYEPSGLVQSVTRPSPAGSGTTTTTFTYDALGNVLTVVAPGNNAASSITTTYNYTTDGVYSQTAKVRQPLTVTDNLGHAMHLRYDAQGRVTSATDALGNETDVSYTLAGQVDAVTLPATGQTGTGHGRRSNSYLYAGGPLTATTVYDESNAQVRQVTYGYGLEGESLSVAGGTEPVTYTYDALYRLKTLKDGNNNTTTYTYNSPGYLSQVQMPGGETVQFPSYDSAGHLLQRIDANGVTTNYLYTDAENRLTDIQYPATPTLNVHFSFDTYGRRTSMTDGTGVIAYVYGNADEIQSVTTTYAGMPARVISYGYYANGSRQSMTTPAGAFSYAYDAAGRLSGLTNPFGETASWVYWDNGWLKAQTLGTGLTTTYAYNSLGQLTELLNKTGGGATLSQFSNLLHDAVGNRTSLTASIPAAPALGGSTSYQYDGKSQLTQEQTTRGGGYTDSFSLDPAGNPTSFNGATKTYNANNQQTGTGYFHDNNGNPTTYNGTVLSFDPENRLTAYGATLTAGYRGDGLRAWKQSAAGRTYFLYDGVGPVVEIDSAGSPMATNTFGAGGLVSRRANAASAFYTFDPQGSVAQRLDANQSVLLSHLYGAYGNMVSGTAPDPFAYKAQWGYYTDGEAGLQLLTHRYYDPGAGRFLTRDPSGYQGGVNLYGYVANNPVNLIDPLGRNGTLVWPLVMGGGEAAIGPFMMAGGAFFTLYGVFDLIHNPMPGSVMNPLPPRADGITSCTAGNPPRTIPILPLPFAPSQPQDDEPCYKEYIRETGWCGRTYTDDHVYEACMDNAWRNYIRCKNGLPPKPLFPVR